MLSFNGIALEDIAPALMSNIEIDAPSVKATSADHPISAGEYFVRIKRGTRKVKVTFYIPESDRSNRAEYMDLVATWASSAEPKQLILPNQPGKYLNAICTQFPDYSTSEWTEKPSIVFTAFEPAFTDISESIAPCGLPFQIGGNAPASGYILNVNAASVTDPSWVMDGVETIALSGTFAAGTIKVDLDDKVVYLGTVPQMTKVTLQSRFFELAPGLHTITGNGSLFYRQRWL